ncbi:MAG: 16S rRNA (guanine(527)-N(7))-methyltransferase RsmG [Magnetococcales bacterium]|nr:16S rRNA (guanine(527)-N(7))-methyltransferase RsmG [Magnetococcales bacterium]
MADNPLAVPAAETNQWTWAPLEQTLGYCLTEVQKNRLTYYVKELRLWNAMAGLVGPAALPELDTVHLPDAALLIPHVGSGLGMADLGSGGGIPGLVIGLILYPGIEIDLIESSGKKTKFLKWVVQNLKLEDRIKIINKRAEELRHGKRYRCIISRAVGSLAYGADHAWPLLRPGGEYLILKGPRLKEELREWTEEKGAQRYAPPEILSASASDRESVVVRLCRPEKEEWSP